MTEAFRSGLLYTESLSIAYFVIVNTTYALLLVSAVVQIWWHRQITWGESFATLMRSPFAPKISILAPAYNEELTITESVRGHLTLHYPDVEVVVTNDGSKDWTMRVLIEAFELEQVPVLFESVIPTARIAGAYRSRLHANLLVVDKENGGKADALNAGLNACSGELVCSIDADTIIEPDSLMRMARPFVNRDDVIASGGTIRVANDSEVGLGRLVKVRQPQSGVAMFQSIEYARAFLFGRLGWNKFGGNLVISGAFGLFRRSAMQAAGGYERATIGEDMELVVRLRRHAKRDKRPDRVVFLPDPVAWTEVPESLQVLGRQRDRWHRGLADVLWRHRRLLFNPRYGSVGLVTMPYFLFIELLAPLVEVVGIAVLVVGFWLGVIDPTVIALFFALAYGYGLVLTLATLLMQQLAYGEGATVRGQARLVLFVLIENFGYRQITVFWRTKGLVRFLKGRTDWGDMTRKGFSPPPGTE